MSDMSKKLALKKSENSYLKSKIAYDMVGLDKLKTHKGKGGWDNLCHDASGSEIQSLIVHLNNSNNWLKKKVKFLDSLQA